MGTIQWEVDQSQSLLVPDLRTSGTTAYILENNETCFFNSSQKEESSEDDDDLPAFSDSENGTFRLRQLYKR
jgi:hypothetical protein